MRTSAITYVVAFKSLVLRRDMGILTWHLSFYEDWRFVAAQFLDLPTSLPAHFHPLELRLRSAGLRDTSAPRASSPGGNVGSLAAMPIMMNATLSLDLADGDCRAVAWFRKYALAEELAALPRGLFAMTFEAPVGIEDEIDSLETLATRIALRLSGVLVLAERAAQPDTPRRSRFAPSQPEFARRTEPVRRRLVVESSVIYLGAVQVRELIAAECIRLCRTNTLNSLVAFDSSGGSSETFLEEAEKVFDVRSGLFDPTRAIARLCNETRALMRFHYSHGDDRFLLAVVGAAPVLREAAEAAGASHGFP